MMETGQNRIDIVPWQREFGLSNTALAALLGVHPTMVSRWRSTKRVPGPAVAYMRLYSEFEMLKSNIREMVSGRPVTVQPGEVCPTCDHRRAMTSADRVRRHRAKARD